MYEERKEKNLISYKTLGFIVGGAIAVIILIIMVISMQNASKKYTLTFNTNGGVSVEDKKVPKGKVNLPTDLEKDGYVFNGWQVDGQYVRTTYEVKGDTEFTAIWSEKVKSQYVVTFDLDGGTGKKQMLYEEGIVELPKDVTKKGYTFVGWLLKDNLVVGPIELTEDISVKALWISDKAKKYKVTFQLSDEEIYVIDVDESGKVYKPVAPARDEYNFKGWYKDKVSFNFNNPITESITLQGKWNDKKLKDYTATFELNGAPGTIVPQVLKSGEKVTRPIEPVREGYVFSGWVSSGRPYDFNSKIKKNVMLNAQWTEITETTGRCNVTFSLGSGLATYDETEVYCGGLVEEPVDPSMDGYVFVGWSYDGDMYNFNTPVTKNIKLTARFIEE